MWLLGPCQIEILISKYSTNFNNKQMKKFILSILAVSLLVFSCSNDDDGDVLLPLGDYENGILVSGEGGPSSVSFISNDYATTQNEIYFNVNNENLGVYLQSIGFNDELAYIITDNTNSITVVNRYTFEKVGEIATGLLTPRYITFLNGKGYVTNWGDGSDSTDDFIAIIDLSTNLIEDTISVGEGPEFILGKSDKLYVSHKGGYNVNNVISVVNTTNNTIDEVTVNDVPDEMAFDTNGNLVVLSSGANQFWLTPPIETLASITRINTNDNSVMVNLEFSNGEHPGLMAYSAGTTFYVLNNKLYGLEDTSAVLPTTSVLDFTVDYAYGMTVKDNMFYVTDASFTGQSKFLIYDLSTSTEIKSFDVGIGASKSLF